jgi:large subunit ribosomal protein L18
MDTRSKIINRTKRKMHVRKSISGVSDRPRMTVYRSSNHIYVQLVDDKTGKTLASSSDVKMEKSKLKPVQKAEEVGKMLAAEAIKNNISTVVFDRNGYKYHGRVKALADAAREAGLNF